MANKSLLILARRYAENIIEAEAIDNDNITETVKELTAHKGPGSIYYEVIDQLDCIGCIYEPRRKDYETDAAYDEALQEVANTLDEIRAAIDCGIVRMGYTPCNAATI